MMCDPTETTLMNALTSLSPSKLSSLCESLSAKFLHHSCRLVSLLSSPTLSRRTLDHLYSIPLSQKSLLISRHLLSFLHLLAPFFSSSTTDSAAHPVRLRLRDLDSVLLLLFFCEVRHHNSALLDTSPANWHQVLVAVCSDAILKPTAFPPMPSRAQVLGAFVEKVAKLKRFVSSKGCGGRKEVAASAAVVVALPYVAVAGGECVICKEDLGQASGTGRDVCQLPCQHLFHWICVLPWLRKRNTCPCCRFQLPTDDVYGEIQRLWDLIAKASNHHQFGVYPFTSSIF